MKLLRYVGNNGCLAASYEFALTDNETSKIDIADGGNVTLNLQLDGQPLDLPLGLRVRDLLDLAVAIYVSDELCDRNKTIDGWTRDFEFIFPVFQPQFWTVANSRLVELLKTLSGDRYSFLWEECSSTLLSAKHRAILPIHFDCICLFSGGIDSLLGAYNLLSQGKRVLLVGHQADAITASTQTEIVALLRIRFPGMVSFVQARVARSQSENPRFQLSKKVENSHRPRSLLFLCLAVALASARGILSIVIPENGLIALNIPLQLSRLGTLSTRTAHPLYLTQLAGFLKTLGVYEGEIRNPFLYQSKTDILKGVDEDLKPLLQKTVSCSHPDVRRWMGGGNLKHCGYCVPCIYRRIALAEAGINDPTQYIHDPFVSLKRLSPKMSADFRALTSFAKRVVPASEAQRQMMLMEHGAFSAEVGANIGPFAVPDYSIWSEMLLRWANDYLSKIKSWSTVFGRVSLAPVRSLVRFLPDCSDISSD